MLGAVIHGASAVPTSRPWMRRTLWSLGLLWLLYLIAGNVFLNTRLGERTINREPERFHAEWAWAASLWPGHVSARRVTVGGHAQQVVWAVHAQWAHGRIALLPLLRKELRFPWTRATTAAVAIDRTERVMSPQPADGGRPWTVRMDDIATSSFAGFHVRGIDITGTGGGSFAFVKALQGGPFRILPSRVDLDAVRIVQGDRVYLEQARVFGRYAMPSHRRETAPGEERLALLDAQARIEGRTPTLSVTAGEAGVEFDGAAEGGRLEADLAVEQGFLVEGGTLSWSGPVETVVDGDQRTEVLRIDGEVEADALALRARLESEAADSGGGRLDADLRLEGRRLFALQDTTLVDRITGTVEADWHFASLRWLGALLLQARWFELDGAGRLQAALRIEHGLLAPGSTVTVPEVALSALLQGNRIRGQARLEGEVTDDDPDRNARVHLAAERFEVAAGDASEAVYLRGTDLELALRGAADLTRFADTLQARLRFAGAQIPDLRAYNRYLPEENLRFTAGSGTLDGDVVLDGQGEIGHGRLAIDGRRAGVDLAGTRFQADIALDSRLRAQRTGARRLAIDGTTLRLDDVRLLGEDTGQDAPWWARFTLEQGEMDWQEPFRAQGRARLDLRNIGLLLTLFAERTEFPGWVAWILDAGETQAQGDFLLDEDGLVLDRVHASNERFDVDARVRVTEGASRGDLYLSWGVFGLSLELDDGQRQFHFIGARDWYDARPDLLPAMP